MKKSFRTNVFNYAHQIAESTGKTFAICLVKAWELYRLTKAMKVKVVRFAYEKADGSLRYAEGTLKQLDSLIKGNGHKSFKTVRYYDLRANGFRSFKSECLVKVY